MSRLEFDESDSVKIQHTFAHATFTKQFARTAADLTIACVGSLLNYLEVVAKGILLVITGL